MSEGVIKTKRVIFKAFSHLPRKTLPRPAATKPPAFTTRDWDGERDGRGRRPLVPPLEKTHSGGRDLRILTRQPSLTLSLTAPFRPQEQG